ncbi:MAG: hypothetical protein ACRD82_18855 [Blastocatellia bacterium]
MKKNSKEERKASYERRIFREFADAALSQAKLEIDLKSIVSEAPPKPDISCAIGTQKHHFEMTEITDENLAKRVSISQRDLVMTGGASSQDGPLIRAFTNKSQQTYADLDGPLELLAYYDKQYPPPPKGIQKATLNQLYWVAQEMVVFGPWSRLWIYDTWNKRIIWLAESTQLKQCPA